METFDAIEKNASDSVETDTKIETEIQTAESDFTSGDGVLDIDAVGIKSDDESEYSHQSMCGLTDSSSERGGSDRNMSDSSSECSSVDIDMSMFEDDEDTPGVDMTTEKPLRTDFTDAFPTEMVMTTVIAACLASIRSQKNDPTALDLSDAEGSHAERAPVVIFTPTSQLSKIIMFFHIKILKENGAEIINFLSFMVLFFLSLK